MSAPFLTYLDTTALMRWAEAAVSSPTARNKYLGSVVEGIIRQEKRAVIVSRLGIMEFRNNVAINWRSSQQPSFDQVWAQESLSNLMHLVVEGTITVVDDPPRVMRKACSLVDLATREHGMGFKVWDAIHLCVALAVGHTNGSRVEFVTTDGDFGKFVSVFPHFGRVVTINNIDPGGW